jgi:hypothetical protein
MKRTLEEELRWWVNVGELGQGNARRGHVRHAVSSSTSAHCRYWCGRCKLLCQQCSRCRGQMYDAHRYRASSIPRRMRQRPPLAALMEASRLQQPSGQQCAQPRGRWSEVLAQRGCSSNPDVPNFGGSAYR